MNAHRLVNIALTLGLAAALAVILLAGGVLGLAPVQTSLWGGLMVTLVWLYVEFLRLLSKIQQR